MHLYDDFTQVHKYQIPPPPSSSSSSMEKTKKIIRRTIFTFLKNYHSFTSKPTFLLLPFSASILFSQSLLQSPPPFLLLPLLTFSLFPLVMAKSSILKTLNPQTPRFQSESISPLLKIQTLNMGLLISLSAAYTSSKSITSVSNHPFLGITFGALYYTICSNTSIIFNLAFVLSITESTTTFGAISEAFSLRIGGSKRVLLLLALPPSLGFAAIGALFRHRMVRDLGRRTLLSIAMEGLFISYLYSTILVLDTIACFLFIKDQQRVCSRFGDIKVERYYCSNEEISEDLP